MPHLGCHSVHFGEEEGRRLWAGLMASTGLKIPLIQSIPYWFSGRGPFQVALLHRLRYDTQQILHDSSSA